MNAPTFWSSVRVSSFACIALSCSIQDSALGFDLGGRNDITAVAAKKSADYIRARLPNGDYGPESYAFADGGLWPGGQRDASIDKLTFLDVAHTIAYALESQAYLPSKDPAKTKLLIVVYWGGTVPQEQANTSAEYANLQDANSGLSRAQSQTSGPGAQSAVDEAKGQMDAALAMVAAQSRIRDQTDFHIAQMLGYDTWWDSTAPGYFVDPVREHRFRDVVAEVEDGRYFVVLMAYDFQLLWTKKQAKLLWETRFSVRERQHQFDRDLAGMAQSASQFFGQDSHGLVHGSLPDGHVEIGPVKSLGEVSDPAQKPSSLSK